MMSFLFSSAASFLLRLVIGAKYAYGVAVNEFVLSPCKQFLCLEMKFVSELLVWDGVCTRFLVELSFLDGIAVGVEKVKGFFGIKAFIVFFSSLLREWRQVLPALPIR